MWKLRANRANSQDTEGVQAAGTGTSYIWIGEVQARLSADVKMTEDLGVNLRVVYSDRLETVKFKPSQDLKKGDTLKITIEKV